MISIYARQNGVDLLQYAEHVSVETTARDVENEFRIDLEAENGDLYFVYVPAEKFNEFVRACQKLNAKGIFNV